MALFATLAKLFSIAVLCDLMMLLRAACARGCIARAQVQLDKSACDDMLGNARH